MSSSRKQVALMDQQSSSGAIIKKFDGIQPYCTNM